ncbi:MAG: hypothetical protein IJN67_01655 [Oscillospiraceae bacterium]|nr:hypothetical protein [Oscillospiraceae bacterium]
MTAQQITNGLGLRKALAIECAKLIDNTRKASNYCYAMEREYKMLSPKGYAGFQRIYNIWTDGRKEVPPLFIGDIIRDRDMARGTIISIWLYYSAYPEGELRELPMYLETNLLLEEMMCGGWYA